MTRSASHAPRILQAAHERLSGRSASTTLLPGYARVAVYPRDIILSGVAPIGIETVTGR
jgi:hypothetical protein